MRPPGDETACGSRKSPYSGNYRRYRTPPAPIMSALDGVVHSAGETRENRRYTPHNHRPRAKDNDEPAELPSRPTL